MEQKNNLNTLAILYLVKGILTLIFSLFFIFYIFLGTFLSTADGMGPVHEEMPFNIFNLFIIFGLFGFILTIALGVTTIMCNKYIKERSHHTFIFIVAIINCLTGILGILLGVFTLIEISKPEVKSLFEPTV